MKQLQFSIVSVVRVVALIALASIAPIGSAQTITTFDGPSSSFTHPSAINPAGEITGYYVTDEQHGFVRLRNGNIVSFDIPNAPDDAGCTYSYRTEGTAPVAINPAGQVTGAFRESAAGPGNCLRYRGFLRDRDGTISTFAALDFPLSGTFTYPAAINPEGDIVGSVHPDLGPFTAFERYSDGTITTFDIADANNASLVGINPSGEIVGYAYPLGGFLRRHDGTMTIIGRGASPTAINPKGEITGYDLASDGSGRYYGFLRQRDGTIREFEVPNSTNTLPLSINPSGQITGVYLDAGFAYHGFVREQDGCIVKFDVPNSIYTYPTSINPTGGITGWYSDASGVHGFVRSREKAPFRKQ